MWLRFGTTRVFGLKSLVLIRLICVFHALVGVFRELLLARWLHANECIKACVMSGASGSISISIGFHSRSDPNVQNETIISSVVI